VLKGQHQFGLHQYATWMEHARDDNADIVYEYIFFRRVAKMYRYKW